MKKNLLGRSLDHARLARDLARYHRETDPAMKDHVRSYLIERMGRLRGLPHKLGQNMSLSDSEDAARFRELTTEGSAMRFPVFCGVLEKEWGAPWNQHLAELEQTGVAASLGQVHRGRLHDGRAVAVKVAYPGIREAVFNDLKMLGWLGKGMKRPGFDLDAYRDVLVQDLNEELDYRIEATHQKTYGELALAPMVVPEIYEPGCCERVLVTLWEEGQTLAQVREWPAEERAMLGQELVAHFLTMFFDHGMIHADPHQGNYAFRKGAGRPAIVLYDFGSVARFDKRTRMALLRLIAATIESKGDPLPLMALAGFNTDLLLPIRARLPALCRALFAPFLNPARFDQRTWERQARVDDILGEERWNLRMSGPPSLLFLIRGFHGVLYYLNELDVQVSWHQLIQPLIRKHAMDMMLLPLKPIDDTSDFSHLARNVKLRVQRDGTQTVKLTLPLDTINRLESVMGEEIAAKVRSRGINLREVARRARAEGLRPGDLFLLEEDGRSVRVWLE